MKNATSNCGRFQFQCHSGDCIAIYNACDGIQQCDDGSDEGPEVNICCLYDMNEQKIECGNGCNQLRYINCVIL